MKEKMYSIAVRRRENSDDHFWLHHDYKFTECKINTCGGRYWFADPFLFEKDGIIYIFYEAFDLVEQRGKEAYSILCEDGTLTDPKIVIDEMYHLSFPNIFEYNDSIYIMPEMCGDYSLKLYKAVSFPDKWIISETLLPDVYACDSIFIDKDSSRYLLTNEMYHNVPNNQFASCWVKNHLYQMDGLNVISPGIKIADGDYGIRNAGKSFLFEGKMFRIGQDCRKCHYGQGMVLFEILSLNPYIEKIVKYWNNNDISQHLVSEEKIIGSHTYNFSQHYEVIDFSSYRKLKTNIQIRRTVNIINRGIDKLLKRFFS